MGKIDYQKFYRERLKLKIIKPKPNDPEGEFKSQCPFCGVEGRAVVSEANGLLDCIVCGRSTLENICNQKGVKMPVAEVKKDESVVKKKKKATDQNIREQDEQVALFETLFEDCQGYIEIRTVSPDKQVKQYYYKPGELKRLVKDLPKFTDTNIYFGVCPRAERKGKEEYIKELRCLWVDLDQTSLDVLKHFRPKPSIIISSGHGYHLYWLLDKIYQIKDRKELYIFKGYTKGLAEALKGDSSFDLSRVLRVPDTANLKDPEKPIQVKLIEFNPTRRYELKQFNQYRVRVEDIQIEKVDLSSQKIPEKFYQMLNKDKHLKATYEGKRDDLKDETRTGFDMSLANILIAYGFKDNEIAPILQSAPYQKGKRLRQDYLAKTIGKVRAGLLQRQRSMHDIKQKAMKIALRGMDLDELQQAKFEPEQFWVSKGLIPRTGFVTLAGLKGTGKTSLILQLCARLIKGNTTFLDQFEIKASPKILYIFAENVEFELLKIINTQETGLHLNLTKEQNQRLTIQPRESFDLLSCSGLAVFKELFNLYNPDLVIFDPIARFLSAKDINLMSVINPLFDNLNHVKEKCLWLFIAHFRKPQAKGKDIDEPMYKISGSSAFCNNCDTIITLDKASKQRSGLFNTVSFETRRSKPLDPIYIGMNPDTRVCEVMSQLDLVVSRSANVEDIYNTLKKDCNGKEAPSILAKYCATKYKVSQERIYELLKLAKEQGLVAKEKGKSGNWYAL